MKPVTILLGIALALGAGACSSGGDSSLAEDEGGIRYTRNSSFESANLRVFLTLPGGIDRFVDETDDGMFRGAPAAPIPGHVAEEWDFVKETADDTSVAHALVSYDENDPADYLMMGWWLEFPGQRYRDRTLEGSVPAAIVDGPEIYPSAPRELPIEGRATYTGRAGGLFTYFPNWGAEDPAYLLYQYEGPVAVTADFAAATLSGCIGCDGDIATRRAILEDSRDDVQWSIAEFISGYELHLGAAPLDPNGTFQSADVTVRHSERTVTRSEGAWGGAVSRIPDRAGNPRLVAGLNKIEFGEDDGSSGTFHGSFVAVSREFRASGRR